MNSNKNSKDLLLFFAITFIWSWLLWLPSILISNGVAIPEHTQILGQFAVFGPLVSAIYLVARNKGKQGVKQLLKRGISLQASKKWLIPTLLLLPALAGASLGITMLITGELPDPLTIGLIPNAIAMFFIGGPLAEEFGWRGFALDKLQSKHNALKSSLILGALWGLWHLPLHFMDGTTQEYIPIWAGFVLILISSIMYTWLHNNTNGSVLIAMLFHWAGNLGNMVFTYWQLGEIGDSFASLPNLWIPTVGMFVSFTITLIVVIVIVAIYKPGRLVRSRNSS